MTLGLHTELVRGEFKFEVLCDPGIWVRGWIGVNLLKVRLAGRSGEGLVLIWKGLPERWERA